MSTTLSPPLSTYFEASNAHDAEALADAFAPDASVRDEGEAWVGRAAIREWAETTFRKYNTRLAPRSLLQSGDETVVTVEVAGNFPGSPVELGFRFRLAGGRIAALEIG